MNALTLVFVVAAVISLMPLKVTASNDEPGSTKCTTMKCAACVVRQCPNSLECKQACSADDEQCGCECDQKAQQCFIKCGGEGNVIKCSKKK
jgi:hypothetical protein